MANYKNWVIGLNLLAFLAFFTNSTMQKETILHRGKRIFLALAPVDPRSLMQGDYMRLNYAIAQDTSADSIPKRGYIVVRTQPNGIAEKIRIQQSKTPLSAAEFLVEYTAQQNIFGGSALNIGAESFFFQEGQAERYETAKYGAINVDESGNSLLIGLYDEHLVKLGELSIFKQILEQIAKKMPVMSQ
jgi:uncharacterized membrane-anchored protein